MKIGELAAQAGCQVQTIRYYEAEGLMQPPVRGANNYREYQPAQESRLAFILRCRSLGMTHDEIRVLLRLQDEPKRSCDEVNALLQAHARYVEERIAELQALQAQIQSIRNACAGDSCIGDCGALEALRQTTGPSGLAQSAHLKGVHSPMASTTTR